MSQTTRPGLASCSKESPWWVERKEGKKEEKEEGSQCCKLHAPHLTPISAPVAGRQAGWQKVHIKCKNVEANRSYDQGEPAVSCT